MERSGAQGVAFIVAIILARVLEPKVYGTVALITVFINIMQVFVDSGLGSALIQKKNADDMDFSTVFYFNIVMCFLLYGIMFFLSPIIAAFYKIPELIGLIRVLSLMLIISGVKNIQQAYIAKKLIFRKFFFATLGGTLVAAVVGIVMVYQDFGVWALVAQMLVNTSIDTIILWITVKWRPKKMFSFYRLQSLFNYAWKLLISGIFDTVYHELWQLIIGKMYTKADLAYYNRGEQFPKTIVANIDTAIDSVLFPVMSTKQDDEEQIKLITQKALKISTYILMPLMTGLAVCAEFIVRIILTDKWLFCVPFLRVFCFNYAFYSVHTVNLNAIKAMGRSDLFLKLEFIKKVIGLVMLVTTMHFGVMVMAYGLLVTGVLCQIINAWPNGKLINYKYIEQIKDILPQIILSVLMGIGVYCIHFFDLHNIMLTLFFQITFGIFFYIGCSMIFKIKSFRYVVTILKSYIPK